MMDTCLNDIIIENEHFSLVISGNCTAKSLICKDSGEECLMEGIYLPLFTLTQPRPFNNEIKLAYPCKKMEFSANRVRREGDLLIVGFGIIGYEAEIRLQIKPTYIAFSLEGFRLRPEDFGHLKMDTPPVVEFRLLQLALKDRKNFGDWLNVSWDEKTAVNVLSTAPQTLVDSEMFGSCRILHAHVEKRIKLKGPGAALIVCSPDKLLDSIADIEEDYDLPRGVDSRRGEKINSSIYWVGDLSLNNVDEHLRYAKAGGFRMMLINYCSLFKEVGYWGYKGNYDYRDEYPNGLEDVKAVLAKVKAAGLTPGIHFLQTHIGLQSRYAAPVADHRLRLIDHFTLAKPLGIDDTTIYVEEDTVVAPMAEKRRVLRFGGELIEYDGYSTEYPFCFTGCKRGAFNTNIVEHPLGQIGGVLDVSEYGGGSTYLDQNSSLADEIAEKLAEVYDCGFEFIYFDGSEGTNLPYEYYIPLGQYRIYQKLNKKPIFTEGAAKAHFSWHWLSGGNAFDTFQPAVFKEMIKAHPAPEAARMKNDFTRVDFGWWIVQEETQPDMFEFGTSRSIAWDCPVTLLSVLERFDQNARSEDLLEVLRRWEDVREKKWLTDEQKEQLKDLDQEHILLVNEQKEYELVPYNEIFNIDAPVSAFSFTRGGENYIVYWHRTGNGEIVLPLNAEDLTVVDQLWEAPLALKSADGGVVLPAGQRRYVCSKLPVEKLVKAFQNAKV